MNREFVERNTKIANTIIGKMKKSRNDLQKLKRNMNILNLKTVKN